MNKFYYLLLLCLPLNGYAHPGIGIVHNKKGIIFYTDLQQVWKIENGNKKIVVPNVHTHEIHLDNTGNLFGEGGYYNDRTTTFYQYLWMLKPNKKIDTVVGMREAYIQHNFSLARDKEGNEYYLKRFLKPHTDTNHIYKKTPAGNETVFATGNFKIVNWLHPQEDGSLLYASKNIIFRVDKFGNINQVTDQIQNIKSSNVKDDILIWGLWQDKTKNIYAAVLSDRTIKKIDLRGNITVVHTSDKHWFPLQGIFDQNNKLWILEGSDKNEVRVVSTPKSLLESAKQVSKKSNLLLYAIITGLVLSIGIFYLNPKNN